MAVVTYIPRVLPLLLIARHSLPGPVIRWLKYVPVAVLASLLGPTVLVQGEVLAINSGNHFLWAALPSFLVAWKTRQMFPTVLVGMAAVAILRFLGL